MRSLGGVLLAVALGLFGFSAAASEAPAPAGGQQDVECPPYESGPLGPPAQVREPGIAPARAEGPEFVTLSASPAEVSRSRLGEALIALPKRGDGRPPADFELAPGARIASSYFSPILCSTVVRVVGPPGADVSALVRRAPTGAAVVRNDVYRTAAAELRPLGGAADPYRELQWGLDRTAAEAARPVTNGHGARVALLDSMPDVAHRDLAGVRVRRVDDGPEPRAAAHGSLLAGIVHAIDHNGFGIAGIAPGAELLSIPVCTPTGASASDECPLADLLRGADLAWEEKAHIVNLSLVGPANPLLERAMDRLDQLGVLLVAAVGNEVTDEARYPAAYPSVIGVGAVDASGAPYARGNRGEPVEVLAPGVEIVSTIPGDSFSFGAGTSLAAAHVSAVLALLVAANGDPLAARTAFFQVARERQPTAGAPPSIPPVCAVLDRLGKPCP